MSPRLLASLYTPLLLALLQYHVPHHSSIFKLHVEENHSRSVNQQIPVRPLRTRICQLGVKNKDTSFTNSRCVHLVLSKRRTKQEMHGNKTRTFRRRLAVRPFTRRQRDVPYACVRLAVRNGGRWWLRTRGDRVSTSGRELCSDRRLHPRSRSPRPVRLQERGSG